MRVSKKKYKFDKMDKNVELPKAVDGYEWKYTKAGWRQ